MRIGEYWDTRGFRSGRLPRRGCVGGPDPEAGGGAAAAAGASAASAVGTPGPVVVEVGTPEYAAVWQPQAGRHREPRPGLLTSVVRAGGVIAYPPPLFDEKTGRVELPVRTADAPGAAAGPVSGIAAGAGGVAAPVTAPVTTAPRPAGDGPSQQAYGEVRALVGALVEVLAGRRPADQLAVFLDPGVREALRGGARVRFGTSAGLRRVRLSAAGETSEGGGGVEATALVQDGARLRAVAFRFDRVPAGGAGVSAGGPRGRRAPGWLCTALQAA